MSAEEAAEYALSQEVVLAVPERPPAAGRTGDPLTRRERGGGGFGGPGLTNRQIASKLHLSERTVENHVSRSCAS